MGSALVIMILWKNGQNDEKKVWKNGQNDEKKVWKNGQEGGFL